MEALSAEELVRAMPLASILYPVYTRRVRGCPPLNRSLLLGTGGIQGRR